MPFIQVSIKNVKLKNRRLETQIFFVWSEQRNKCTFALNCFRSDFMIHKFTLEKNP